MSMKLTTEEFIKRSIEKQGDKYDYSKVRYVDATTRVTIICRKHGEFRQLPYDHYGKRGRGCPKCGGSARLTAEEFIEQSKKKHCDKYDYSEVHYINNRTKVIIGCPIHGEFKQAPCHHMSGNGCPKCAGRSKDTELFIRESLNVHGDKYDYSLTEYRRAHDKVTIVCPVHGEFRQTPTNHLSGFGCPGCTDESVASKLELEVYETVKSFTDNIVQWDRETIKPKQLDLLFPDHGLAIEVNGTYWHSTKVKQSRSYHKEKSYLCDRKGVELWHLWEYIWANPHKRAIWLDMLKARLGICERIFARKCEVVSLTSKEAKAFLEQNHIQGSVPASTRIGLTYQGSLVAVMTFGKARFTEAKTELLRFCSARGTRVVGAASRLLAHADVPYPLISYANRSWSNGELYRALGFMFSHDSEPNYVYVHPSDPGHAYSRIQFQKHKLENKLSTFDPGLSEVENMRNNSYLQIFDAGNKVFIKRFKSWVS